MPPSPHAAFSTSRTPLRPSQRGAEQDFTEGAQAATLPAAKSRKRGHLDEVQSRRNTLRIDTNEGSSLKPTFQVDRFAWPKPCDTLLEVADATLGQLAEALMAESRGGRKAWYLTSTRRAEGRTTLAICVARYLAQRGVPVALVDADFQNPQLARRLGVLPQVGWESVLDGSAPLGDAMIHATGAGVTLLPLLSTCIDPAHVSQNTGDNEWYTPKEYITSAEWVLRGIDLDPASTSEANEIVKAHVYYTADANGLDQEWHGRA